jgi:rubrerythrin
MDIIIILIILGITILIGYVLSRPFISSEPVDQLSGVSEARLTYEDVLKEIKVIEAQYEAGDVPEAVFRQEIEEKKHQAADLLRQMNSAIQSSPSHTDSDQKARQNGLASDPENSAHSQELAVKDEEEKICSNCGSTVVSTDKFCPNCGRSLSNRI